MLLDLLIQKAHKEIFDHIISLYASSKLPHALLFTGPQGVGKFDVAKALAEKILPPTSTRADLHILEPETQMKSYSIDQIREVQRLSTYSPYEGGARLFIFKDAERLTAQASNAFLKILEEPPASVIFMLATTDSHKIIETVRSRCFQLFFGSTTSLICPS
jgi:DNA polymerase-3 subunit delta'